MNIACIGWGSLVWDPRQLPIRRGWYFDGPLLPIEFAGQSKDGRVTLVLLERAPMVRALWSLMNSPNIKEAKDQLALREGTSVAKIGFWSQKSGSHGIGAKRVATWAKSKQIDAVVWAALDAKIGGKKYHRTLADSVVTYLQGIQPAVRTIAESYIRNAPLQIDTNVRRRIEQEFGWNPSAYAAIGAP